MIWVEAFVFKRKSSVPAPLAAFYPFSNMFSLEEAVCRIPHVL